MKALLPRLPRLAALAGGAVLLHALTAPTVADAVEFTDVAVGGSSTCGLADNGTAVCLAPYPSFASPADLPPLADIQSGVVFSCGLTLDGDVRCWGRRAFGTTDVPAFDAPIEQIAVGPTSACALDGAGVPTCWGLDSNGQLSPPDPESGFARTALGTQHGCGIRLSGETVC